MKCLNFYPVLLAALFCRCHQRVDPTVVAEVSTYVIDSTLSDSLARHIQFKSDRHFSQFNTPIDFRFYSNDLLTDSIVEPDFNMMSWYGNKKDTIDLTAHVGEIETMALLVRFIADKPTVFYFRASHEKQRFFRINKTDSFSSQIEVPPTRYRLLLSALPDAINKPVIYGYIEMESGNYYDQRDSLGQRRKISMKFYFRSQFIKFNY